MLNHPTLKTSTRRMDFVNIKNNVKI